MFAHKPCFIFIFLAMSAIVYPGQMLMTDPPLIPGRPFLLMWNCPFDNCKSKHDVLLDLSHFDFVSRTEKNKPNQSITLFYTDRYGIYPDIDEKDHNIKHHGGVPQNVNMTVHLDKAEKSIDEYIPVDWPGLAVLDFEDWRLLWRRNWNKKSRFRKESLEPYMKNITDPQKREELIQNKTFESQAKEDFEHGAKRYFVESIRLGKRLRPKRKWGYYLYPDCYNYGYNQNMATFTGKCPDIEKESNDKLKWLWKESTALYPSIYLEQVFTNHSSKARQFVRHRINETMRVSMLPNSSFAIPMYPYIRPVYKDIKDDYMSVDHLVNTIGEAAALGAAGIISWGDMDVSKDEVSCKAARDHLANEMNPYMLNVSTAARLCSEALCQGQGRCVRKRWDDDVYLHLDARRYRIERYPGNGPLVVRGNLSQDDVAQFNQSFDCICFSVQLCHSALTLNVFQTTTEGPKDEACSQITPHPLLLLVALLALYVVM